MAAALPPRIFGVLNAVNLFVLTGQGVTQQHTLSILSAILTALKVMLLVKPNKRFESDAQLESRLHAAQSVR
jgi:hypothetical protein